MFNSPSKCNHIESQTKAPQTSNNSNLKIPTFKELIDAYNIVTENCYRIAKQNHNSKDCVRYLLKEIAN